MKKINFLLGFPRRNKKTVVAKEDAQKPTTMAEVEKQYPSMFSHPEAKPDEICVGDQIWEAASLNASAFERKGFTSVRLGEGSLKPVKGDEKTKLHYLPIFVSREEYMKFMGFSS